LCKAPPPCSGGLINRVSSLIHQVHFLQFLLKC